MATQSQCIHTYARIKPLFTSQQKVYLRKNICTVQTKNGDLFGFDCVFDYDSTNQDIYNKTTRPIIQQSFRGYNGCVLAYGQTSSGKTHTMKGTQQNLGIIPLCLQDIFKKINQQRLSSKVIVSYMEIYNENIIDLLADQDNQIVDIKDDKQKILVFTGLKEVDIGSIDEAMKLFSRGQDKRKFASNNLNVNSSRSHAIFRISLNVCDDNLNETSSQINLVDLAGSEGLDRTRGQKIAKIQGQNINKSLLALTKVIKTMSQKEYQWVSFRDSKLTRILRGSLCQNSKSSIICMINPTNINYQQSMNTLKFGQMAAKIKIQARQNLIRTQQTKRHHQHRAIQFLPSQKMQLEEARIKIKDYCQQIYELNEQAKHLAQDNFSKQNKMIVYQRRLDELSQELGETKQRSQINRQQWQKHKHMLEVRLYNYQEQIQRLQKMNVDLKSQNRQLQKNEKGLAQTLQYYENQCRSMNQELTNIRSRLDEQNSKMSKNSSYQQQGLQMIGSQRKSKNKINPFQLPPYKQQVDRLSPNKLSWVIDLSRKVNEYTKANIQIAEQNEQLRNRLQECEQKISRDRRSSSKINPQSLQYNEIKKLSNKIKSLRNELRKSQQRQKKNRDILKKQSQKNLIYMQQFEQWYNRKYNSNIFIDEQIQTEIMMVDQRVIYSQQIKMSKKEYNNRQNNRYNNKQNDNEQNNEQKSQFTNRLSDNGQKRQQIEYKYENRKMQIQNNYKSNIINNNNIHHDNIINDNNIHNNNNQRGDNMVNNTNGYMTPKQSILNSPNNNQLNSNKLISPSSNKVISSSNSKQLNNNNIELILLNQNTIITNQNNPQQFKFININHNHINHNHINHNNSSTQNNNQNIDLNINHNKNINNSDHNNQKSIDQITNNRFIDKMYYNPQSNNDQSNNYQSNYVPNQFTNQQSSPDHNNLLLNNLQPLLLQQSNININNNNLNNINHLQQQNTNNRNFIDFNSSNHKSKRHSKNSFNSINSINSINTINPINSINSISQNLSKNNINSNPNTNIPFNISSLTNNMIPEEQKDIQI